MGWIVKATTRVICPRERGSVPIVQEAGLAPGLACKGAENLTPLGCDPRTVQLVVSQYTDYAIPAAF